MSGSVIITGRAHSSARTRSTLYVPQKFPCRQCCLILGMRVRMIGRPSFTIHVFSCTHVCAHQRAPHNHTCLDQYDKYLARLPVTLLEHFRVVKACRVEVGEECGCGGVGRPNGAGGCMRMSRCDEYMQACKADQ